LTVTHVKRKIVMARDTIAGNLPRMSATKDTIVTTAPPLATLHAATGAAVEIEITNSHSSLKLSLSQPSKLKKN